MKDNFISALVLGRKFSSPVITHAVLDKKIFLKIIKESKIKIPSETKQIRENKFLESFFKIKDCVYFSAGWEYNSTYHHWPFAFIFKANILKEKEFETFKTFIISQGWMNVLRYWKDYDLDYLRSLSEYSQNAKKQVKIFLKRDACSYWVFENELSIFLDSYKDKKKIFNVLKKFKESNVVKNSNASSYVKQHFFDEDSKRRMEIVSHKRVSLDSKNFLGFYIRGQIPKDIKAILQNEYKGKILFNGKEIKVIK